MRRGIRGRTRSHGKNSHEESQDRAETKNHASTIKKFQFSANGILQEREDLLYLDHRGNSSVGRASASQAERRGFESLFPLKRSIRKDAFLFVAERDRNRKEGSTDGAYARATRVRKATGRDLTAKLAGPKGERADAKRRRRANQSLFPLKEASARMLFCYRRKVKF